VRAPPPATEFEIAGELGRLRVIRLSGPAGTVVQTAEPTAARLRLLPGIRTASRLPTDSDIG
jgi:hypothetical protein